jgi:hypothetical protein
MPLRPQDVVSIQRLLSNYNHILDFGTSEEFVAVWAQNGELETPVGVSRGHDDLRKVIRWNRRNTPGTRHVAHNVIASGDGVDASACSYVLVYQVGDDGVRLLMSGRYSDILHRVDGQWKFVRRILEPDSAL